MNKNGSVVYSAPAATELISASMVSYLPAGAGAVATTVQAKLRESVSVFDFIPTAEHASIIARTSTYNCITAITQAMQYVQDLGGGAVLFPAGTFPISSTIVALKYVSLLGVYGETLVGTDGPGGTVFKWTGGNTGNMLRVFDIRESTFSGFCLDGQSGTAVVGIFYSSTAGSSAENHFFKFSIRECFTAVKWGTTGLAGTDAAQGRFENFTIWSAVPGSWGFIINSGNVGQQCSIEMGGIQCGTAAGGGAIDILVCNLLQIRRVFGGGTHAAYFIRAAYAKDVIIEGCSSEMWGPGSAVAWRHNDAYFLYQVRPSTVGVDGDDGTDKYTITLIQNQINNPIQVTWKNRIVAIGNGWGDCRDSVTEATVGAHGFFTSSIGVGVTASVLALNEGFDYEALEPNTNEPIKGWRNSAFVSLSNFDPRRGWVTPPFNAAKFTANTGGPWTVSEENAETFAYTTLNRTMTLSFKLNSTVLTGTTTGVLKIVIPLSKVSTKGMLALCFITNGGVSTTGFINVGVGGSSLDIQKLDLSTFAAGSTTVHGQISFEIP